MKIINENYSNLFLSNLKNKAIENIDFVLSELGIDIDDGIVNNDELRFSCPVHGGDNPTSFSINTKYGTWRCYSHKCHDNFGSSIIDLVKAVVFKESNSFIESVEWLCNKLGISSNETINLEDSELHKINNSIKQVHSINNKLKFKEHEDFKPFDLKLLEKNVKTSDYFLNKGFSLKTLKKFHIGFCNDITKPMHLRSFAPIIDEDNKNVIGVTGRTIYEKCPYCPWFHQPNKGCPKDNPMIRGYSKWKHFGFKKSNVLYNFNNAKEYIRNTKSVVITEGPKEIWFLDEYKIYNAICLFGLDISIYQIKKLIEIGVENVYLMLDTDEKGLLATEKFFGNCQNYFDIININHLFQ